jgi:hypothetical protein
LTLPVLNRQLKMTANSSPRSSEKKNTNLSLPLQQADAQQLVGGVLVFCYLVRPLTLRCLAKRCSLSSTSDCNSKNCDKTPLFWAVLGSLCR